MKRYLAIYIIKKIIEKEGVKQKEYSFVGLNLYGNREYFGSYIIDDTSSRNYLDILQKLKSTYISESLFIIGENNSKLINASGICFPSSQYIISFINILELFKPYILRKDFYKFERVIKSLYLTENDEEFETELNTIKESYNSILINHILDKNINFIKDTLKYNKYIRKIFVTLNFVYNLKKGNNSCKHSSFYKKDFLKIMENIYTYKKEYLEVLV